MHSIRLVASTALLIGCGTPPPPDATADTEPAIRFVFPTSELAQPVCPDFLVAVDIDNFDLVDPNGDATAVDGRGHWHLDDDITGDYLVVEEPFVDATADLDGESSRNYRLTAALVNINHTPLSLEAFPLSIDTVEFQVADSPDCIGDGGAVSDR